MRVSLVNLNLVARDAVGRDLIDKVRFFRRRGDQVRVYVQAMADDIPDNVRAHCVACSLNQLISGDLGPGDFAPHFRGSDLYIYDYPIWYELVESIRGVDRGVVILDYHGVTPRELWGLDEVADQLVRSVDELPQLLRYTDYAVGHSAFTRDELVSRYGFSSDKTFEFPYAVPLDDFVPGERDPRLVKKYGLDGKKVLLYVGRMAGNKRVDLLIRALPLVQARYPGAALLLVGDNDSSLFKPIVASLEALARELGLERSVTFTGRVDDLPAHYRLADVYVTSSLHEGFCVPLVESMAMGLPIVGTNATAIPYTLGDAGLTFEPEDVEGLAAQVIRILDDSTLANELRQKGWERVKDFGPERFATAWNQVLERALAYQPALTEARVAQSPSGALQPPISADVGTPVAQAVAPAGSVALPDLESHFRELEAAGDISMRNYQVRSRLPIIGPLIAWIRRNLTSHLKEPYVDPIIDRQVHMNRRLVWDMRDLYGRLRELAGFAQSWSGLRPPGIEFGELRESQAKLAEKLTGLSQSESTRSAEDKARLARDTLLREKMDALLTEQSELAARQDMLAARLHEVQSLLGENPQAVERDVKSVREALQALSPEMSARLDALVPGATKSEDPFSYFIHADAVGGQPAILRKIYAPLVEHFREVPGVLDLGCGSGYFLELLREAGIPSYGVDLDEDCIRLCRQKGLDARQEDMIAHLRSLPDKSVGGIFAAHVIEHLPLPVMWEFVRLCYQKLLFGAPFVLVTPNGAGLTIFYATFYKDLTHVKPLHPEALRFVLESVGFRRAAIDYISPTPEPLKLGTLDPELAQDEVQRQWALSMNRSLERLNALLFGDLDCVASAVK